MAFPADACNMRFMGIHAYVNHRSQHITMSIKQRAEVPKRHVSRPDRGSVRTIVGGLEVIEYGAEVPASVLSYFYPIMRERLRRDLLIQSRTPLD